MKENILIDKSIAFAARIVKLHDFLIKNKKGLIIAKQVVRSGTSIGANINEANYGQSPADFISKMHIALKETAETEYWIKLLNKLFVTDRIFGKMKRLGIKIILKEKALVNKNDIIGHFGLVRN